MTERQHAAVAADVATPEPDDRRRRFRSVGGREAPKAPSQALDPQQRLFGRYLALRLDLLPPDTCARLSSISDIGVSRDADDIARVVRAELRQPPEALFTRFDETPFDVRLLSQTHRARTKDGIDAAVTVLHTGMLAAASAPAFAADVKRAWARVALDREALDDAVAGFRRHLARQLADAAAIDALELVADDACDIDSLQPVMVRRDLSSVSVRTTDWVDGVRLDTWRGAAGGEEPAEIARVLVVTWLRQALLGQAFPLEPRLEHVTLLPRRRIAFTHGLHVSLSALVQRSLRAYLAAIAADDLDAAYTHIAALVDGRKGDREGLRRGMRQLVPFREGLAGSADDVAEQLLLHWRLIRRHGFRPCPELADFYTGCAALTQAARALAPHHAALREAVRDLRIVSEVDAFRHLMSLDRSMEMFETYGTALMQLPQRLDATLSALDALRPVAMADVGHDGKARRGGGAWFEVLCAFGVAWLLLRALGA